MSDISQSVCVPTAPDHIARGDLAIIGGHWAIVLDVEADGSAWTVRARRIETDEEVASSFQTGQQRRALIPVMPAVVMSQIPGGGAAKAVKNLRAYLRMVGAKDMLLTDE